jgi:serine/threonine-protein kinase RsbW
MKHRISLTLPPDVKFLRLAAAAGAEAARCAFENAATENQDALAHALELALSEVFANTVRHRGAGDPAWRVVILLKVGSGALEVVVKDRNPAFDIETLPPPDIGAFPESGYGLYLVKQIMDCVTVHRKGGWNVLTMTKIFELETKS